MHTVARWLEIVFGRGEDTVPVWLLTVRINILLFAFCVAALLARRLSRSKWWETRLTPAHISTVSVLTLLAGVLRFALAAPNLMDFGGIPYSRLLIGYKGYFATAQFYAPLYELTTRDMEHGIFFQRVVGTATVPLVYLLCLYVAPGVRFLPASAAFLFAVYPMHIMFSASDALAVFTAFLTASSYLLVASGAAAPRQDGETAVRYLGGFAGLALLTQVRYENVLLLLPPALFLLARRRALSLRQLLPGMVVATIFLAVYASEALEAGFSYGRRPDFWISYDTVVAHLVLNPFAALPVLLVATLAAWLFKPRWIAALAPLPLLCAGGLAVIATDNGHGAARIYANWLILILPLAAHGLACLLGSRSRIAKALGGAALIYMGVQPLLVRDRLATQYVEMVEHDRFNALLATLSPLVKWIIVPDDELLHRDAHSTLEVYHKYATILWARPAAARLTGLVGITEYLEQRQPIDCTLDACVFFFGLPCLDADRYLFTGRQCLELLSTRRVSVLDDMQAVAAPFVHCSIYTGELGERLCDPATTTQRFTTYRIEP